ncbi:metallophosphoesterase [Roseibium polysiphoniae]|uniref:Metallophosphoesterase n=2 Tax=Roseibium polysiphoniae TaxID=2571221 RepID=A0A944CC81_9HYPH|nr:metallophosphoesterase [Roseibium polysiphoniae]
MNQLQTKGTQAIMTPAPAYNEGLLPTILGTRGASLGVPESCVPWPLDMNHSGGSSPDQTAKILKSLRKSGEYGQWKWPKRPVVFISDLHADAESLVRSLIAAGVVQCHENDTDGFDLTDFGRSCVLVIGGDCLDKGPSNLDLLNSLKKLIETGVRIKLLAGNHDLRLLLGVRALTSDRSPLTEHMFMRMGNKVLPLMREVYDKHVAPTNALESAPDLETCRDRIFPSETWQREFPEAAAEHLGEAAIQKELRRLRKKIATFEEASLNAGLDLRMLYAAAMKCRELFLEPDGLYAWFYDRMRAIYKNGSVLFVHAGLDDHICAEIDENGVSHINQLFQEQVYQDPFTFYSGTVANIMRTKYRAVDKQLSSNGVERLHRAGVKILVHGHVNRERGQRLKTMKGLLHLEADITLDRNSRKLEGLKGIGTGATIILPNGNIVGFSNDFPYAKVFTPEVHMTKAALQHDGT